MAEMLLVNPRRRRRKTATRKRRSPTKRRTVAKRRRNPARRVRRRSYGRRSNPSLSLNARSIKGVTMNALPGAAGALALDVALGYLPIPDQFRTGLAGYAVKIGAALGLGILAKNVVRPATAVRMTEGALTVMFHGVLKSLTQQYAPGVQMAAYEDGMGYYGAGWNPSYDADGDGMSAYLSAPAAASMPMYEDENAYA